MATVEKMLSHKSMDMFFEIRESLLMLSKAVQVDEEIIAREDAAKQALTVPKD